MIASRTTTLIFVLAILSCVSLNGNTAEYYVAPGGSDENSGTREDPFATITCARDAIRQSKSRTDPVTVHFMGGMYYLGDTLVFRSEDSGTSAAPVRYVAEGGEAVTISGGIKLELRWLPFRDGIMKAAVPAGFTTDQLFVDGRRQPMARYPNFDPKGGCFNGTAADAFSPERAKNWANPRGGFIHAMHRNMWGDFHYIITGKDNQGNVTYEGGWQNNRRMGMHGRYRMVENIFEELDAPGEWFLDRDSSTLYFFLPDGVTLETATIEAVRLRHLIEFRGTPERPVRFISIEGVAFRHAARTFMENREPLLRSDWTTYRGGAVLFNGAEDCALLDCTFDQVGGNAVFVNNYNRRVTIRGCEITRAGANGVAFVGDPNAVRSPLFEYAQRQNYADIDKTPGPKTNNYPSECLVEDCLIHQTGRVEKQTAPVQIAMSMRITVRHCSIYDVPRAGINIGDGCWGGHTVEFCDVFDTVKETGDHGSFNSWGRDRYWGLRDVDLNKVTLGPDRDLPILDMIEPTVLRNNRWRCDHGWDIDLDDGSSRYEIRNNLCLNGGIKLREGFHRVCENNIMVNGSFQPHVWYQNSQDVFRRNIVFTPYRPIRVPKPWGKECDRNLLHEPGVTEPTPADDLQKQSGRDAHSIVAEAMFVNARQGDYRVKEGSPALGLGFRNFPMDQFGVVSPHLRAMARTPRLPGLETSNGAAPIAEHIQVWLGGTIRSIAGLGDQSAYGLPEPAGVLVVTAPAGSRLVQMGLQTHDVIIGLGDIAVNNVAKLLTECKKIPTGATVDLRVIRDQRSVSLRVEAERF